MDINIKRNNLIYPYFVMEGKGKKQGVRSFPGVFRFSLDKLLKDVARARQLGLGKILLFGIPPKKDGQGSYAYSRDNIVARAARGIKKEFKDLTVITDVCLCAYTTHGHCGVLEEDSRQIDLKRTLASLADTALSHAAAGADYVAPSAMVEGQVFAIKKALVEEGFNKTKIMGYSAKFASNFYGPFREAANSSPKFGDRSAYQLAFSNSGPAMKKIASDIKAGADIVVVKPALAYLDIIKQASGSFHAPLAAYNVSGEYAMVKLGAKLGLWNEQKAVFEIITAIRRAGADLVITYHAKDIAKWLEE